MKGLFHSRFDNTLLDVPYKNNEEYLLDILKFYEIKIVNLFKAEHEENSPENLSQLKGLVISKDEVLDILRGELNTDSVEGACIYSEDIEYAEEFIDKRVRASLKEGVFLPLVYINTIFNLNHFERHCVMLAITVELNRKFEKLYGFLQDDITLRLPTLELAIKLYTLNSRAVPKAISMINDRKILDQYFFSSLNDLASDRSDLSKVLKLNSRILNFILDTGIEDEKASQMADVFYPNQDLDELLEGQDMLDTMKGIIKGNEGLFKQKLLLYLKGKRGTGKKFLVKHLCRELGQTVLFVDVEKILRSGESIETNMNTICREALIHGAALCFFKLEVLQDEETLDYTKIYALLKCVEKIGNTAFVLSEKEINIKDELYGYKIIDIEFKTPGNMSRFNIWEKMLLKYKLKGDIDISGIANKFQFTPGLIKNSLETAKDMSLLENDEGICEKTLYSACFKQVSHKLPSMASIIKPVFKWEDIVLSGEAKKLLKNACDFVKYNHIVQNQWGFDKKLPYGKGLSILLYGPPGTGKTMAAQVVANELQLEIYKIDLSETVSKYIGETEKNLQQLFDRAKESSMILFFDEADALFGKRSEVKDSHDRYANMEVSYLLQRIEEHEGITILATNFIQNFDEAFKRRINFIVEFPFPGPDFRRQIWQNVYPKEAPVERDIDFDFLAERFELTGSNIKNIALFSAYLAADDGTKIEMRHILTALKYEYGKIGKTLLKDDLGPYYNL
ncbi:AAA family ATPase [Herbivorax sp. ANBcel31]|uniref:AAA family ATPase n=1 Tax=Herbivorax sp. ANBcel31 TaxID=3069754 RepID=UPI0027B63622|nr:AAA family ATPase [Herbivorax sp. ANBcel31]MDQ2085368.1 AAA family ATPase [Herbivorax sp. ANBcel31]